MSLCSARWHTGQNVGCSLVRMRQLSAGRNIPLAEYPPPSYTPTGYFACSLTGVGTGVPFDKHIFPFRSEILCGYLYFVPRVLYQW